ncbi:hypothetical protein BDY19DRAFT_993086 [Irpex rosettiformis]|uniref:Uncharacterized protein n=1 Tax=Irpex rosettiformis TaxID=378272 RepID=A0ACB8U5C7_9APHY|nr:hypothetical protein BDY19DRAFT_993086 [Irpex rosettiformis]
MTGFHLATSVSLLSSIAAQTAIPNSKRAQYIPVPDKEYMPRTDALDGSLGLFLVMCGLILLFVLAVTVFFWRVHVHRRSRRTITTQDIEEVRNVVSVPALLYKPGSNASHTSVKLPPSIRIRSPVKNKLKFFKFRSTGNVTSKDSSPSSSTGPRRPIISKNGSTLSIPSIVVSECSPVIPTLDTLVPDNTAMHTAHSRSSSASSLSSVSSTASTESLRVPESHKPRIVSPVLSNLNTNSSAKRGGRKVEFKNINRPKGPIRSSSRGGKENAVPPRIKGGIYDMTQLDHEGKPVRLAAKNVMASHTFM